MTVLVLKTSNFQQSKTWEKLNLKNVHDRIQKISRKAFEDGIENVYLHSRVYTSMNSKDFGFLPCLDVESMEHHHSSIVENIGAAKELLTYLCEKGLTEKLSIFATGSAFRFCWPFVVPKSYKRAFLKFIQNTNGIDPNPQKNNSFLRVLGYRGNSKQGKPIKNVHVHKLLDIDSLFSLNTEKAYLSLINGRPDFDESLSWLPNILPTEDMSAEWSAFLDEWKSWSDIQSTIWNGENPTAKAEYIDDMTMSHLIDSHLETLGITHSIKQIGTMQIKRLSVCPICGRRGCAYSTEKGVLKCWHANSCTAGKRAPDGKILGIKSHEWIPGYQDAYEGRCPPSPSMDDERCETVEQIRARLKMKLQSRDDVFIGVTPGVGKTRALLKAKVPLCDTQKYFQGVLYVSPTHDLCKEVADSAHGAKAGRYINIFQLKGRSPKNCTRYPEVEKLQKKGFTPGVMLCPKCESGGKCKYYDQFKNLDAPGFGTATHHLAMYNDLDKTCLDTIAIDEDSLPAFFRKNESSLDEILSFSPGYLGDFFRRIIDTIQRHYEISMEGENPKGHNRIYVFDPPAGSKWDGEPTLWERAGISDKERSRAAKHLAYYQQNELESMPTWLWRLYDDEVNFAALKWLLCALGEDGYPGNPYIKIRLRAKGVSDKVIYRFVRSYIAAPKFSGQIIVLDGTGTKKEADALFERDFELIEGRAKIKAQKTWIRRGLGKIKSLKLMERSPGELKKMAVTAIDHLRPQDQNVLIATHLQIEEQIRELFQSLLPDRTVESVHYYGNRGVNAYKDFDAVIAFGAPGTNQDARLDEALLLFPDPEDRAEWFQQKSDAELVQTLHRIRPIYGDKNIIVIARRWPPDLGKISYEIDARKGSDRISHSLEKAYRRVQRFYKIHGFCTFETLYALGIGPLSRKELISKAVVLSYRHLIEYIFIGDVTLKPRPFERDLILFKRKNSISDLIRKLEKDFVGQRYEVKIHSQWTTAYGSKRAAQEFYRMLGVEFKHENWRKVS